MKETVSMNVDKEIVSVVHAIQVLKDCGIISIEREMNDFGELWDKLTDRDKLFITGMIKGSAVMLTSKN